MEDIRVCFVVNAVGETSVPADIATAIQRHTPIDVDLLCWWDIGPFHGDDIVDTLELDAPNTRSGIDRATYRQCRTIFEQYDLVQAHHCHSGSIAKLIAAISSIPSVSREGNMRRGFTRQGLVANGLTNPLAERVVCNAEAVIQSFRPWERWLLSLENINIIANGVDLDRIDAAAELGSPIPEQVWRSNDLIIGTAGVFGEQKDHETLLRGFKRATKSINSAAHLAIAGDGDRRDSLEYLARELEISDQVHFLGLLDRDGVYSMFHELDIYVMPSKWEGFSAAAVEAMACGLPCVFSDIPAFTLPYEDVAVFHEVGDPADLADRLVALAKDSARREALGEAGRDLVERQYRIENIAREYAGLYESILA